MPAGFHRRLPGGSDGFALVQLTLHQCADHDMETQQGEDQIQDAGVGGFLVENIHLLSRLIGPVEAVNIAGDDGQDQRQETTGVVVPTTGVVQLVGDLDKPVEPIKS